MQCELPTFLESATPTEEQPLLTTIMYRDRESTKPVRLSLIGDYIYVEMGPNDQQTSTLHRFKLQFEVKFTLMRQPTVDKMKLGDPYGLKFERNPNESTIEFYCQGDKEQLLLWRDHLARKINQRGFHQLVKPSKKIGKGNSATVYLAERLEDRKKIAVKAFAKEALTVELKGRESLVNEINVMRALEHRCLMKLYEVFESDNSFYLVIEHLEGGQLFEKLNNRRFKVCEIQDILRNLTEGLTEMHKKRIIHRDLKPQNLIFRTSGTNDIVIADYGLATWADVPQYIFVRCGTPGYVAPEIINCKARNGQQPISDIFSLGVIAHILATGRSPFPGKQYNQVLSENRQCNFNFQLEIYKSVDPLLMDLIIRMMQVDPTKRLKTQQVLQHDFFKKDYKQVTSNSNLDSDANYVTLPKDKQKKKEFTKIQDSVGSFVVARPNMLRGTDSAYMSMTSAGSSQSVPSSPQSIKESKFLKREREPEVESIFKVEAKGSEPRKRFQPNPRVGLDELRDPKPK